MTAFRCLEIPPTRFQYRESASSFYGDFTGTMVEEKDLISIRSRDLSEAELGYQVEPFVRLLPAFKDYLWGGTRLLLIHGKKCDYEIIAESWELSAHKEGQSIVASGRHKGHLFSEYLDRIGKEKWGWKCQPLERFPLLVKLIDAKENLSVQVHPDDCTPWKRKMSTEKMRCGIFCSVIRILYILRL